MPGRLTAIALALLLVAAACGDDSPATGLGPAVGDPPTALEAAEAAVASLGDDLTAALAILVALDRGYTPRQIVEAVTAGELLVSGVVARGGEPIQPDGTAAGLIVDKGPLDVSAASGTMILAFAAGAGGGITVDEAKGYLEAFDGWVQQQVAPAEPEPEADAEELRRLIQYVLTLTMLRAADAGWSAEEIINALIFQDFVCIPYEGCFIPGEPASPDAGGVLASPTATTIPPAGDSVVPDGVYRATFEPDYGSDATVETALVSMIVSEGRYALTINIDYTTVWTSGDGSLSCTNYHEVSYEALGVGSTTSIMFTGPMVNEYTSTCEGGGIFASVDDWHVQVRVDDLTGQFQLGEFRLVREE